MKNKFQLPDVIKTHFQTTNTDDPVTFISTFSDDAIVIDAGNKYHGKSAIKKWSEQTYFEDHLRLKITNIVKDIKGIVVTAIATGDFDKTGIPDPLFLDFHFFIIESKIGLLHIVISSNFKGIILPTPIATYYHACDIYDVSLLEECFKEDAVLHDEDTDYHGPIEISNHILNANRDANVTLEITDCTNQSNVIVVAAILSGNFEGSPLPMDFHFSLDEGKIKSLKIIPNTGDK
ncbi:nuclear transport factor 2 family protein [Clostridium tyrobutyricum]|uniref:nuclear transport factor 2 family protein n=1 Tax=Clostridium tyrobutyricum TaxID=1519 RepID=UPI001A9B32EA|nr:nuclear transport factor 2 family protein [Clostridium tyrobutyricum]